MKYGYNVEVKQFIKINEVNPYPANTESEQPLPPI